MSSRRRLALVVLVCAQVALPLGLAGLAAADLAFGEEIRLRAQPVDPLDVFRGNFVVLRYDISQLEVLEPVRRGDRLCADLFRTSADTYTARFAHRTPSGGRSICGRARSDANPGESAQIEYGIETYFANADRAREIEGSISRGDLFVVVDLDADGSARIERLETER